MSVEAKRREISHLKGDLTFIKGQKQALGSDLAIFTANGKEALRNPGPRR